MQESVRNNPFSQRLAHSFCRAARGRCDLFEWRQELHSTDKRPQGAAFSSTSWCIRGLHPHPHRLAEKSTFFSADLMLNNSLAADDAECCQRHACSQCERRRRVGNGMPRECGPRGPCMHRMYRFFRNFLLASRMVSAACASVPDGYVKRPWDLDSDIL